VGLHEPVLWRIGDIDDVLGTKDELEPSVESLTCLDSSRLVVKDAHVEVIVALDHCRPHSFDRDLLFPFVLTDLDLEDQLDPLSHAEILSVVQRRDLERIGVRARE
jgi:hypothetical protein